jgi:hypothetical protein
LSDHQNLIFSLCIVALVLSLMLFGVGLVLIYWGDEYAVPSWSEESVPAPAPPYSY